MMLTPVGLAIDSAHPINRDIQGWWPFIEGSGHTVQDISGQGNHGTVLNSKETWVGSPVGSALTFDGVDDRVDMGDPENNTLDVQLEDFSQSIWFKCLSTQPDTTPTFVYKGATDTAVPGRWMYSTTPGLLQCAIGDGTSRIILASTTSNLWDDEWHFACWTADRDGLMTVYLDGEEDNTTDISAKAANTLIASDQYAFGDSSAGGISLAGDLTNGRCWLRELTAEEVRMLYNDPFVGTQSLRLLFSPSSLFRSNENYSGLGSGGPFYANPIG